MANHAQNSPRGLWAKAKFIVGTSSTVALTGNSTGLVLSKGIKISNARQVTANSTGFIVTGETALPATDQGVAFTMGSNSTGAWMAVNTTATTWKYLNVTTKQPA
jgi:hypothetical protein